MEKSKYFSQFSWAIPIGFSDALRFCQFGEGDILYQKKSAYQEEWDAQSVGIAFQVTYPSRSVNAPKEDSSAVFKNNWNAEVRLQKYECKTSKSKELSPKDDLITTTQGRLYTSVWKGDLDILNIDTEAPVMPTINAKEATSFLENTEKTALEKSKGKTVFVMPFDRSNSISNTKFSKIIETLKADLSEKPILLTAKKAGINDWELFLPTVDIALLITPKLDAKVLHDKVKKATYAKAKNTKREAYDIKKHGAIFS